MTRTITDRFHDLIHGRPHYSARGFTNIDCPACGDRRKRGGFAPTTTGGWRYYCYNGGCTFHEQPTGWEPGNGLFGRPLKLFHMLGGKLRDIPFSERVRKNKALIRDRRGNVVGIEEDLDVVTRFHPCELPEGSDLLAEQAEKYPAARMVLNYLNQRGPFLIDKYPFCWTQKLPNTLLIPYVHGNIIVGYLGRNIYAKEGDPNRFIQRAPTDFMFNQNSLNSDEINTIVVEAPLDAIAVEGVATRGSKFTQKQVNLLRVSGKEPILVPDFKRGEWGNYLETAETYQWSISIPDWAGKLKDVGESITRNGLLFTTVSIVQGATKNYKQARVGLEKIGRVSG